MTAHLCWQDRISKEVNRVLPPNPSAEEPPVRHPPREIYPIGGRHKYNNGSSAIVTALGPSTWHGSGGLKSTYSIASGRVVHERNNNVLDIEAAREEAHRAAAAHQLAAVKQRGERSII